MSDDARADSEVALPDDPQAYVAQVMAEIDEEVRLRRASGDLPPKLERELDELFLAHSPVAGRGRRPGARRCAWSTRPRSSTRWCRSSPNGRPARREEGHAVAPALVRGLGHPPDEPVGSAVSRALHIVDDRLRELQRQLDAQRIPRGRRGRVPRRPRPRRLVGRAGGGRRGQGAGPDPARGLRRRLAGAADRGSRGRRLRRRPPGRRWSSGPSSEPLDLRAEAAGRAPAGGRRGRAWGPWCSPGRSRAWRAAERERPARCHRTCAWHPAARWSSIRPAGPPGRAPMRRPRPIWRRATPCVPTPGAACWSCTGTWLRHSTVPGVPTTSSSPSAPPRRDASAER